MIRKSITIEDNEPFLRQISKNVRKFDKSLLSEIEDLNEYCKSHVLLALASIQIGISKRIIYLKNTNLDTILEEEHDESKILINPKIINRIGHTKYWEACASCLNNMGLVSRPYKLKIKYIDENKKKHIKTFTGFEATVLSHELDHLNGILHIDIAEKILKMPKEERKIFRENHPYEILSKDCNYEEIWNQMTRK